MSLDVNDTITVGEVFEIVGLISAELATAADAWNGNAPEWFPEPPEWITLVEAGLAALEQNPTTPELAEFTEAGRFNAIVDTATDEQLARELGLDEEPCSDPDCECRITFEGEEETITDPYSDELPEDWTQETSLVPLRPGDILHVKLGMSADAMGNHVPFIPGPDEIEAARRDWEEVVPQGVKVIVTHFGVEAAWLPVEQPERIYCGTLSPSGVLSVDSEPWIPTIDELKEDTNVRTEA